MNPVVFALLVMLLCTKQALCLTSDCETELKMVKCCELYEKSISEKLPQFGEDLARQCQNEIIGAGTKLLSKRVSTHAFH